MNPVTITIHAVDNGFLVTAQSLDGANKRLQLVAVDDKNLQEQLAKVCSQVFVKDDVKPA